MRSALDSVFRRRVSGGSKVPMTLPPISVEEPFEAPKEPRKGSKKSVASMSTTATTTPRVHTGDSALWSLASSIAEEIQNDDVQSEWETDCGSSIVPVASSSCFSSPRNSIGIEVPPPENSAVPRFRRKSVYRDKAQPALINSNPSMSDLYAAICDVTSCAEVVYFCSSLLVKQVPSSISIVSPSGGGTCDFAEKASNVDVAIFIVEDNEGCIDRAASMLSKVSASMTGCVSCLLMGQHHKDDHKYVTAKIARLMDAGAHDVALVPKDPGQLQCIIAASLAKAEMFTLQESHFERKLTASKKQCHHLFWEIAHEVLEGMPQVRENLTEEYGQKVGHMEMLKKVGKGATCDVYSCRDSRKGKDCVVKVFKKDAINSVDQLGQIVTEYETLRALKHPNIVEGINLVQGVQNVYLFMESAGTENLFWVIQSGGDRGLLWSCARELLLLIVAGVAHMHDNEVAHCDLKPENIVISSEGRVKLVDFGQVVHMTDIPKLKQPRGTMPFMAPEMLRMSANWNPILTDMWSLGVIMLEMLCGNHMFTNILGWQDRDLASFTELDKCADELSIVLAKQAKHKILAGVFELCRFRPPCFVRSMLSDLLELTPESRLHAKQMFSSLEESH